MPALLWTLLAIFHLIVFGYFILRDRLMVVAGGPRISHELALELGFDGKICIHPSQVPVVNEAFTPTVERIEWARRVLDAAEEAEREGRGVFRVDGEMVDAPLIGQAEQVRERARAADAWD